MTTTLPRPFLTAACSLLEREGMGSPGPLRTPSMQLGSEPEFRLTGGPVECGLASAIDSHPSNDAASIFDTVIDSSIEGSGRCPRFDNLYR